MWKCHFCSSATNKCTKQHVNKDNDFFYLCLIEYFNPANKCFYSICSRCPYNPNNHSTSLILTMKCDTTLFQTKIKLWSIMDNELVLMICLGFGSCLFLIICWTCYYLSTSFSSWKSAGMKNSEDGPEISQNDTLNNHGYHQGQFYC